MTQQERIERMDQIDLQMADLRNEYRTLSQQLINEARKEELDNAPARAEVQTLDLTAEESTPNWENNISYQAMRAWLDNNTTSQSPETPGETREAIKASALHASRSLNGGWWPTNGMSQTVQSDLRETMQNDPHRRELILKCMRTAIRDWSHEHNHGLQSSEESLRESLDRSLSEIRQEQRDMRIDTGLRVGI